MTNTLPALLTPATVPMFGAKRPERSKKCLTQKGSTSSRGSLVKLSPITMPKEDGKETLRLHGRDKIFLAYTPHVTGFARSGSLMTQLAAAYLKRFPISEQGDNKPVQTFAAGISDGRELAEIGLCLAARAVDAGALSQDNALERLAVLRPVTAIDKNRSLVARASTGTFELRSQEQLGIARLLSKGGANLSTLWQSHLTRVPVSDRQAIPISPALRLQAALLGPEGLQQLETQMYNDGAAVGSGKEKNLFVVPPYGEALQASPALRSTMGKIDVGNVLDLERHMPDGTGLMLLRNVPQYFHRLAPALFERIAKRMPTHGLLCLGDSDVCSPSGGNVEEKAGIRQAVLDAGFEALPRTECIYSFDESPFSDDLKYPLVYQKKA